MKILKKLQWNIIQSVNIYWVLVYAKHMFCVPLTSRLTIYQMTMNTME